MKLVFRESFGGAFRSRAQENLPLHSSHSMDAAAFVQTATNGTRFLVLFRSIPEHVGIFVTTTDVEPSRTVLKGSSPSPRTVLVAAGSNGAGGTPADFVEASIAGRTSEGIPIVPLDVHGVPSDPDGRYAYAVWEWVNDDPQPRSYPQELCFGVVLSARPGEAGRGQVRVNGGLAPISTLSVASLRAPVPRVHRHCLRHESLRVPLIPGPRRHFDLR